MSQTFATVATFDQYVKAHIYKNTLEEAGIICFLIDEYMNTGIAFPNPLGGIKLKVPSFDLEKAKKLLKKVEAQASQECVACGSKDIESINQQKRGINKWIALMWGILTFSRPVLSKPKTKCKDCGHLS
ncbi:MAG: putative signal transducing protein [Flammeovirgaceae bacterium]